MKGNQTNRGERLFSFLKREPVLCGAGFFAVLTMLAVPPDRDYLNYFNLPVLSVLFCLMLIVAGLSKAGMFEFLTHKLRGAVRTERGITFLLVLLCFFGSALITNDVALITLVPFTIQLLRDQSKRAVILSVVLETVAANLGSLLTPIGNPQNLYLYTFYQLSPAEFFRVCLPLGGICLLLLLPLLLFVPKTSLGEFSSIDKIKLNKLSLGVYGALFVLCLLTVLGWVPFWIPLIAVSAAALWKDKRMFRAVDYSLLATFVCFFIFVGNAARIPWLNTQITGMIAGKEILVSFLLSQVISNVPAATMLSAFTDKAASLLIGTNIGGLGTLIASMASLISYRQICTAGRIPVKRYVAVFTAVNLGLAAVLLPFYLFVF